MVPKAILCLVLLFAVSISAVYFNMDSCGFIYNGQKKTHIMFTEPGVEVKFSTSLFTSTSCTLRILAVGKVYDGVFQNKEFIQKLKVKKKSEQHFNNLLSEVNKIQCYLIP